MYETYLPEYPSIHDEDFFRRIVEKKEFWENDSEIFFRHQVNIARYMSQWTLFDSLFLYHEMGTGKSGVTVALTEEFRDMYKKVLYIAHNETQIQNYKNEILKFSPRLAGLLERETHKDPEWRRSRWNKILAADGYEFFTLGTIHNDFTRRAKFLKEKYDYSIILVDEAHHLVQTNKDEEKKSYEALQFLLNEVEHKKLLVMTGTPIRDQPDEIVPLLNLVLPKHRQLVRSEFIASFFVVENTIRVIEGIDLPLYRWQEEGRRRFQELIRGRVSYIRREMTNIDIQYMGSIYPPMQSLRLAVHPMLPGSIQNQVYLDMFEKDVSHDDKKKASFYSKSKQASLFVFPDQTIGEKSFDTYVTTPHYSIRSIFYKDHLGPNIDLVPTETKLEFLSQFSTTYTAVFREILRSPHELVYVFSDLVEQSGILLFMSLLKSFFGYQLVSTPGQIQYTPGQRMILLNDQVTHENHFQDLIAYFNDPANKDGQLCQILMSTNKTKEGISLMNIQQIHIMTPSWNMADISQAMARGLRARSHIMLEEPHVRIFLHTAVPFLPENDLEQELTVLDRPNTQDELRYSIDFQRYFRSEIKEKNAKLLERVFLESSWDCMMNMDINTKTGRLVDGSRECEYSLCEYSCEGADTMTTQELGRDASNWRLFYSTVAMDLTLEKIRQLFLAGSIYTLDDLKRHVDSDLLEECLCRIMTLPLPLYDRNHLPRFLAMQDRLVFLVDNPSLPGPPGDHFYYQEHPATCYRFSFHDMMDTFYLRNVHRLLPRFLRMIHIDHPNSKLLFESFPLEFQRLFCEIAIQNEFLHPGRIRIGIRQWMLTHFRTDVSHIPGVLFDHRFVTDKKHPRRLDLSRPEDGWTTVE